LDPYTNRDNDEENIMNTQRKVLIVDDDPVVATSFSRVLSRDGYVVVTAANAAEALDKLNEGEYDVVYTDIKMPGMDGLELAERVKARRAWTPVVIITGFGTEANERRAKAAGVQGFLHKPLSPEMIEASARDAIETAATPQLAPIVAGLATLVHAEPQATPAPVATATPAWKAIGMLIAGPLLGLAYVLLLPFIGAALLAAMALRRFVQAGGHRRLGQFAKNFALFVAAPFIGLAYLVVMPFVGLALIGGLALRRQSAISKNA
jgi:CheY-like chemotaxis protein